MSDLVQRARVLGEHYDRLKICSEAADEIERLTRERDEAKRSLDVSFDAYAKVIAERDCLRAALERIAECVEYAWASKIAREALGEKS